MAIAIDVVPKIDTPAFAENIKLSIARGLLETALDILPGGHTSSLVAQAMAEIDRAIKDSDNGT